MQIIKKHLTNGQYITEEFEKFSLFLHHTISTTWQSAWRWWNSTPERVGTAYIIGRKGEIIECFDPGVHAYHLGIKGDDNWQEKHSIGIEIVSAGPLRLVDNIFRFYPLWPNKSTYSVINPSESYSFADPWKGHTYWHAYSNEQVESLKWLIGKLYLDFPSLSLDGDIEKIFEYDFDVVKNHIPGIHAHCTVRQDKSDIFPYPPLIEALKEVQEEIIGVKKNYQIEEVKVKAKKTSKSQKS